MVTRTETPPSGSTERKSSAPRGKPRRDGSDTLRSLRAAWRRIERGIPELKDDLICIATAKADQARLAGRRAAASIVRGIALGIVGVAVLVTAATLVIDGIAGGIAAALDGNTWLANLITGGGIVLLAVVLASVHGRSQRAARLRRLEERYARHDARQRAMKARPAS